MGRNFFLNKGKDKNQRGQLTIFIIVLIFMIGMVGIFFSLRNSVDIKSSGIDSDEIFNFVQNCVEQSATESISAIGYGGGYLNVPEPSLEGLVPLYYRNNTNYMPEKSKVAEEISRYVDESVLICTDNFSNFPDFKISRGEITTSTNVGEESVLIKVDYPITIRMGNETAILKNFETEIPIRLGMIYDSIESVMEKQTEHEGICLSCILKVSLKNDFYVDMYDYDEETVVFVFRDENSEINNEAFEFVFANVY